MTGVAWQKKGVGHEVFLTEKGGGHPEILVQKGGPVIYYSGIIMEKKLTCNDYCYHRERARQQIKFMYS
jgi:hypothetical protein